MGIFTPFVLMAQTKTYKGEMIIPKETPQICATAEYTPGKTECEAEYNYYEQNGERVKHGKCSYRYINYTGSLSSHWIYGEYTHGKKSGQWLFVPGNGVFIDENGNLTTNNHYQTQSRAIVRYEDDKLNGPFELKLRYVTLKGQIKNNIPYGLLTAEIDYLGREMKIEGKFDEMGMPDGEWKVNRISGVQGSQSRIYKNGRLLKITEVDLSTGETSVLYNDSQDTTIIYDLSPYKKIEKTIEDNFGKTTIKTFYESSDAHYFTIEQKPIFGVELGKVFKEMEGSLNSIESGCGDVIGANISRAYTLIPADEEFATIERNEILKQQGEILETKQKEIKDKYKSLAKFVVELLQNKMAANADELKFSTSQGKSVYFYIDADEIIANHLKYNTKTIDLGNYQSIHPRILALETSESYEKYRTLENEIQQMKYETINEVESKIPALVESFKKEIESAKTIKTIRENMKAAYPHISKKIIKTHYQIMVDNKDAEGLIQLFTEGYKQYIP